MPFSTPSYAICLHITSRAHLQICFGMFTITELILKSRSITVIQTTGNLNHHGFQEYQGTAQVGSSSTLLEDLYPSTTYHARIKASNSNGKYGLDQSHGQLPTHDAYHLFKAVAG